MKSCRLRWDFFMTLRQKDEKESSNSGNSRFVSRHSARNYFEGEEIEIIGCNTFRDVISTIKKDPSILGMMAIENTIAGSLLQNHELIRESGLQVIGEYKLRISTRWLHFRGPISTMSKRSTPTRLP